MEKLETSVQLYGYRKNCRCPQLKDLWEQIKKVDKAQEKAQEYSEEYIKDPKEHDKDSIFMNVLRTRVNEFNNQTLKYKEIFKNKILNGDIIFKIEEKEIDTIKLSKKNNYSIFCKYCETEIPKLDYPEWS